MPREPRGSDSTGSCFELTPNPEPRHFENFAGSIGRRSLVSKVRFRFSRKIHALQLRDRSEDVMDIDSESVTIALFTQSTTEFC